MKANLIANDQASDEKVKTAMMKWLGEQPTGFYEAVIHALIRKSNIAIERKGDYVGKEGCDSYRNSFILMFDSYSCVCNYPYTKEKGVTF